MAFMVQFFMVHMDIACDREGQYSKGREVRGEPHRIERAMLL